MMMKIELTGQKIPVKTAMAQDLTGVARAIKFHWVTES